MMRTHRVISVLPVITVLLLVAACIHKSTGAVTPWERVHTYNAALAEANNAVEQGMEVAASSKLVSTAQAAPVIAWCGQVAILHAQITGVLAQGQATQANVQSVQHLVDLIKSSITQMPSAALGIKNPRSQQTFQQDVQNVGALAGALLAAVEAVQGTGGNSQP
jgi:hypothetical protein